MIRGAPDYITQAGLSSVRYQVCASMIPVVGVLLIMVGLCVAGCRALSAHVGAIREARMIAVERPMKPPLPESTLAAWLRSDGGRGTIGTVILGALMAEAKRRARKGTA